MKLLGLGAVLRWRAAALAACALLGGCGVKSMPRPPGAAAPELADGGRAAACAPTIAPAVTEAEAKAADGGGPSR